MRGKFITIEGQDGAGKSTNVAAMQECLTAKGVDFIHTREPGGTSLGENIRELLLNSSDIIADKTELLMMFAARAQHIEYVIEPALSQGKWVLCDRFTDATYAYQGSGRGLGFDGIKLLEAYVQDGLTPDLTLLLDLPIEVSENRAGQRSAPDRFEKQKHHFKQKVRDCYLARAEQEPHRIKVVDASQSLEQVKESVLLTLSEFCKPYV